MGKKEINQIEYEKSIITAFAKFLLATTEGYVSKEQRQLNEVVRDASKYSDASPVLYLKAKLVHLSKYKVEEEYMDYLKSQVHKLELAAEQHPLSFDTSDVFTEFERKSKSSTAESNERNEKQESLVNHPSHYQGSIECIDALHAALGDEGILSFCKANAMKYLWRAGKKEGNSVKQDLEKAAWYIEYAIKLLTEEKEEQNGTV